jgi:hypothetical protein
LDGLVIDPRAMRMPSAALAAALVRVVHQAEGDLRRQRSEATADLGTGERPDLAANLAALEQLQSLASAGQQDIRRVIDRFTARHRPGTAPGR